LYGDGERTWPPKNRMWGFKMTDEQSRIAPEITDAIKEVVMITRHLVNNPDEVQVDVESKGYTLLIALRTNPKDVGQVIGRNAHLMNSIRSFLAAIAGKNNVQIVLDYVTEEDNRRIAKGSNRRESKGNY